MHYLFSFTFSFDNPDQEDHDEDEGKEVEMCFLLDEAATARTGYTTTRMDCIQPNPFAEWFGHNANDLEEAFGAVHDYSGTYDDHTLVEGFCTYEIDTIEQARELMQRWRDGFVGFLGEEGVGPVVEIPDNAISHTASYASDLRDLVVQLSSPATSGPRP